MKRLDQEKSLQNIHLEVKYLQERELKLTEELKKIRKKIKLIKHTVSDEMDPN